MFFCLEKQSFNRFLRQKIKFMVVVLLYKYKQFFVLLSLEIDCENIGLALHLK